MLRLFLSPVGLAIIGAVILFFWLVVRTIARSDDPARIAVKWCVTFLVVGLVGWMAVKQIGFSLGGAFVVPFVFVLLGIIISILWAPHLGATLAKPITAAFDGGSEEPELRPLYSIAIAQRKRGRFREAIYHIQEQLQKFPNDSLGHMLLAEIQADDLKDVAAAETTIHRLCAQEGHAPEVIASALNQLADAKLKHHADIDGASNALQKIADMFPGSQRAQLAGQRIAQLSRSDMCVADRTPIRLKAGAQDVGLMENSASLKPAQEDTAAMARQYVAHLEAYPQDVEVRENLAELYAEHYGRVDLAIGQLNDMVSQPNQPPKLVARWLNRVADLCIKHENLREQAREALNRIIELYPASALAAQARQRLDYLEISSKVQTTRDTIKMGTYEQDIGLKQRQKREPS